MQLRWFLVLPCLLFMFGCYFGASQYFLYCPIGDGTRQEAIELSSYDDHTSQSPKKANSTVNIESSTKKVRCAIYTYFQPLGEWSRTRKDQELIRLWQRNWYSHGWKPQILAERDARRHPQFDKYFNHFKALPSVNPNDYEVSCYIRWLALQQAGGGLHTDYDIFLFGPLPLDSCGQGPLSTFNGFVPMVSWGNSTEIQRFVDILYNYQLTPDDVYLGKPQISDMVIGMKRKDSFNLHSDVPPLVHYSTWFATHYNAMPKAENVNKHMKIYFANRHWVYHLAHFIGTNQPLVELTIDELTSCKDRSPYCKDHRELPLCSLLVPKANFDDYQYHCHYSAIRTLSDAPHFSPSSDAQHVDSLDLKPLVVIFIEHPMDRIALEYEMQQKDKFESLDSYLSSRTPNPLLRSIVASDQGVSDEDAFELAKERISRDDFFIGLHSNMMESLLLLEFTVGFDITMDIEHQLNVTTWSSKPFRLSTVQMALVERMDKWDIKLYSHVVSVFHERLDEVRQIAAQLEY